MKVVNYIYYHKEHEEKASQRSQRKTKVKPYRLRQSSKFGFSIDENIECENSVVKLLILSIRGMVTIGKN